MAFDGAFTVTVPAGGSAHSRFDLVRVQAKLEPPLRNMRGSGGQHHHQHDCRYHLLRHAIRPATKSTVTGPIGVNFADFADPS